MYSAIPKMSPTAHKPHTQYKARYRSAFPYAGWSVAHANTAVTKMARKTEARKRALFVRLRRPQASQPVKILVTSCALARMSGMVAGASVWARENSFGSGVSRSLE